MKALFRCFLVVLILTPLAGLSLGPHELLLLINADSPESVRVGELYARLRRIPEANMVRLSIADAGPLSADAFRTGIWEPAWDEASRRGVAGHILAWVYAPGFPWRIAGDPGLSLTGLTFLRGRPPPDPQAVRDGQWRSPYFAGPDSPAERGFGSRSLDVLAGWMGEEKPMAAWMLSVIGHHGLTVAETEAMLIRGVDSDSTRPQGAFYAVTNADVRSRARDWQWEAAADELRDLGQTLIRTSSLPRDAGPVLGVMAGHAVVDPRGIWFPAGGLGDHLTSFGAVFLETGQSRCTVWLQAGAVAAGGTVVEPFAHWTKFPHARLWTHYAAGCTVLEIYYQSIRCPLQYLPLGDPLAAPCKARADVTITGLDDAVAANGGLVRISASDPRRAGWVSVSLFLDGREVWHGGLGDPIRLDLSGLAPGPHECRAVVRTGGLLRNQAFSVRMVDLPDRESP